MLAASPAYPARRITLLGMTVTAMALPLLSFGDSTFLDSPITWAQTTTTLAFFHASHPEPAPPAPAGHQDHRPAATRPPPR